MSSESISVSCVTINTANLNVLVNFYKALGLALEPKKVTLGSDIYCTRVGSMDFMLFGIKSKEKSLIPPIQLGFKVSDLNSVMKRISEIPNIIIMMEPTQMPEGRKAIVLDPDGHSVELLQA